MPEGTITVQSVFQQAGIEVIEHPERTTKIDRLDDDPWTKRELNAAMDSGSCHGITAASAMPTHDSTMAAVTGNVAPRNLPRRYSAFVTGVVKNSPCVFHS